MRIEMAPPAPPLPSGLPEALLGATPGNLCDAQGGRGALPGAIRPVTAAASFAGRALTVELPPGDHLALWAAITTAQPGDVLVIATGGFLERAILGDLMAGLAVNAGVVALVTDGALRDAAGIEQRGLVAFAAALCPTPPLREGGGRVGHPVTLGGITVASGDLVVGNRDGVSVVPRDAIPAALEGLAQVRAREAAVETVIAAGGRLPAAMRDKLAACGLALPGG